MMPKAMDLFCGCGGFSLGFLNAGYEVVAAVDNSTMALATYWHNLCDGNTKIIGEIPRKHAHHFNNYSCTASTGSSYT